MVVDFENSGDICILRLRGRFATGQDTAYLRSRAEELKAAGCKKVLADFSDVSYIDSTGIGFLIGIYISVCKNPEGHFVLANPNHRVRGVLQLTRLATVIPIYADEESAKQALEQGKKAATL